MEHDDASWGQSGGSQHGVAESFWECILHAVSSAFNKWLYPQGGPLNNGILAEIVFWDDGNPLNLSFSDVKVN